MFTGIIREKGKVRRRIGNRLELGCTILRFDIGIGDSANVNGACLTAAELTAEGFIADLLPETVENTTLGSLRAGTEANLELALAAGERFGGHFIQGHVDGVVACRAVTHRPDGTGILEFDAPDWLRRWLVPRGSIAVDGVSLTLQELRGQSFTVALIPATARDTTLGNIMVGARVNIEADMLVKAVRSTLESMAGDGQSLDSARLKKYGYGE